MERKGLCMYSLRNLDNLDQSTLCFPMLSW